MKARLKVMLPGFTGNMDDVVIYYNAHLNKYIARKKVMPTFTPDNQIVKDIFAFARRIKLSKGYLDDCREHIKLFNRKNRRHGIAMSTWPNVFLKVMRKMIDEHPELEIKTLTREEISENDLPCRNIAAAIDAGYLDKVTGYGMFNKCI